MTPEQQRYYDLMTPAQARQLLDKFDREPAKAEAAGPASWQAFVKAWSMLHPNEYWQRATVDGKLEYKLVPTP